MYAAVTVRFYQSRCSENLNIKRAEIRMENKQQYQWLFEAGLIRNLRPDEATRISGGVGTKTCVKKLGEQSGHAMPDPDCSYDEV